MLCLRNILVGYAFDAVAVKRSAGKVNAGMFRNELKTQWCGIYVNRYLLRLSR